MNTYTEIYENYSFENEIIKYKEEQFVRSNRYRKRIKLDKYSRKHRHVTLQPKILGFIEKF